MVFDNYKVFDSSYISNPPWQDTHYAGVVERAQLILRKRTRNNQKYAIGIINMVFKKLGYHQLPGFAKLQIDRYSGSPTHVLRYEFDNESNPDGIKSHNHDLAELLAVLALALVQESFLEPSSDPSEITLDFHLFEEAEEAIDWAERYHNGTNLPTDLLDNVKQLADKQDHRKRSTNAKTGYALSDDIKQRFIDGWIAGEFSGLKTRMDAALHFFKALDEDDVSDLHLSSSARTSTNTRGARLLCSALRQYLNDNRTA